MALSYILRKVAKETGANLLSPTQRSLVIEDINTAAEEVYNSNDLLDCLDEEVFDLNVAENQVSLPWYAEFVRGMRWYDGRLAIDIEDPKNRYFHGLNTEVWNLRHRKKKESPLSRDIDNQSRLRFQLPVVESSDIVFNIVGETPNSEQFGETIVLVAGDLSVETTAQYINVVSIDKNRPTTYDIKVFDVNDNELSEIPNHLLNVRFHIMQITDSVTPVMYDSVEVLYKKRFTPFVNDRDMFICGDRYDMAIVWKYLENRCKSLDEAIPLRAKCEAVIKDIWSNAKPGVGEAMCFTPGPYLQLPYRCENYHL